MGSIRCDKTGCEHNEILACGSFTYKGIYVCKRRAGYDYGGGDIQINKNGYCTSSKLRKVTPLEESK